MTKSGERGHLVGPPSAVVARTVGIVCIALGFVVGMEGLDETGSVWLRTALGLIFTGLVAQGYALYRTIRHRRGLNGQPGCEERKRPDEKDRNG